MVKKRSPSLVQASLPPGDSRRRWVSLRRCILGAHTKTHAKWFDSISSVGFRRWSQTPIDAFKPTRHCQVLISPSASMFAPIYCTLEKVFGDSFSWDVRLVHCYVGRIFNMYCLSCVESTVGPNMGASFFFDHGDFSHMDVSITLQHESGPAMLMAPCSHMVCTNILREGDLSISSTHFMRLASRHP